MDRIISAGGFTTANGKFVSAKEARIIERIVTDYEIA